MRKMRYNQHVYIQLGGKLETIKRVLVIFDCLLICASNFNCESRTTPGYEVICFLYFHLIYSCYNIITYFVLLKSTLKKVFHSSHLGSDFEATVPTIWLFRNPAACCSYINDGIISIHLAPSLFTAVC